MRGMTAARRVWLALPVLRRRAAVQTFPPGLVVFGDRDVRENRVALDHVVRVEVGLAICARHDAEIAGLWIDRAQLSIRARLQPADVVADGPYLPTRHRGGRYQHRKIRLAAGRRERACDVVRATL